jgi:hypothetical protein
MLLGACLLILLPPSHAGAQTTGTLTGVVREEGTARPVADVEVVLPVFKLKATTDANGRYTLAAVPAGPTLLVGRKLGWEEHSGAPKVTADASHEYNFTLRAKPATLDTMRSVALSPENRHALDLFAEHQKRGFGAFFDSTALEHREIAKVSDLMRTVAGITVITPPLCAPLGKRRYNCSSTASKQVAVSGNRCAMRVVMDRSVLAEGGPVFDREDNTDTRHDWVAAYDIASLNVSSLVAIEVYRRESDVPMEYRNAPMECGLIQLWTNRG